MTDTLTKLRRLREAALHRAFHDEAEALEKAIDAVEERELMKAQIQNNYNVAEMRGEAAERLREQLAAVTRERDELERSNHKWLVDFGIECAKHEATRRELDEAHRELAGFTAAVHLQQKRPGRTWCCRFHPTDWFHETGCPHMTWSEAQLREAGYGHVIDSPIIAVAIERDRLAAQVAKVREEERLAVRRELTEAVRKFNDDDSLGIGQLIDVISPWLLDEDGGTR